MADPADLGAGGTQEYPNYADDEGETISCVVHCLGPLPSIPLPVSFVAEFGTKERHDSI